MFLFHWRRWLRRLRKSLGGTSPWKKPERWHTPALETLEDRIVPTGTWTELTNLPGGTSMGTMELLPNGTVMVADSNFNVTNSWYLLTPDSSGNYSDGTWSSLASASTPRLYDGTVVLPSDQVMVYGGEYTDPASNNPTDANSGDIYSIATNSWSTVQPIPASLDSDDSFGDDPLQLLPNGTVLAGYLEGPQTFIYNPTSNSWSAGPTKIDPGVSNYTESTDEEGWTKLPGTAGNILDYELWASLDQSPGYGEYLDTANNTWVATGSVPVPLSEDLNTFDGVETELGPALLLPNGTVFQLGANGSFGTTSSNTAIYDPSSNSWMAGPVIPDQMMCDDASAAILPDGNVIFVADSSVPSNSNENYNPPSLIFEYNYVSNTISQLSTPATLSSELTNDSAFTTRMLALPSGQILFTDGSDMWTYSENTAPNAAWAPTITSIASNGSNFTLTGTQLNGIDEGAAYGDDANMATNYPLVELTNGSGQVSFAETSNWSLPGTVATGNASMTTDFAAPATPGPYLLSVDTNGISSSSVLFVDMGGDAITLRLDPANPSDLQVLHNGSTLLGEFPLSSFTAIDAFGNGALTVDYSNGVFGMPVDYTGGTAASSAVTIADTAATTSITYNATSPDAGNFVVNGNSADEVSFTNVATAFDTARPTTLTINADPNNQVPGLLSDTFTAASANTLATLGGGLASLNFATPAGTLIVNGHSGGANNITFTSVGASFNSALSVIGGSSSDTVALDANLSLGSATATGDVTVDVQTIDLDAIIDAGAGPTPGSITLTGNVDLTGNSGLEFGGASGLVITGGAVSLGADNLTLTDFAASDTADIAVDISGAGGSLTKDGPGDVTLGAADTYSGTTTINAGTLSDGINNGVPTVGSVDVGASGKLDLDGFSQQVAAVTGAGIVTDSSITAAGFTVDNTVSDTFAGALQGNLSLSKAGAGTLVLTGVNTNTGPAAVGGGALQVDGHFASAVTVNAGTLDGAGQVGGATVNSNGTISAGDGAPGLLTVNGNLTLHSGATFATQMDGITAGTGYGQLIVSGTISLNNATLLLTVLSGFTLPFESAYEILNNTGSSSISTTFSGLVEGGTAIASNGRQFGITYQGGTSSKNVVVTEKPMTLTWDGNGADNNWTTAANWVGSVTPATGDTLTFGAASAARTTTDINNFAAGTSFNSLIFATSGYVLNGNAITLTGGITAQAAATGTDTLDLAVTLNGSQEFQTNAASTDLVLDAVHLAGNTLTTAGPGDITADAAMDGAGAGSAITQQGPGTLIIAAGNTSTYAGPTTVAGGVLEVNGSISSAVTVESGATLSGTGTTGTVTDQSSGNLYQSAAVSSLTTGNLSLQSGSNFNAYIASDSSYSSVTASSVSLGGAVLNLSAAAFTPTPGDAFTLIDNTGATSVSGTLVAGSGIDDFAPGAPLPNGAILSEDFLGGGHFASLSYDAGPNHDSVAITILTTTPLIVTGGTDPNNFLLTQTAGVLEVFDNNFITPVAWQPATDTSQVQIRVASGQDATLTIDYTNPFTVPVTFDGGTGASPHTLTLENGSFTTATFNDTTASSGTIDLDSEQITYSDLTVPSGTIAISDETSQTSLAFNLPTAAQGTLGVAGVSEFTSTTFASTSFTDPAGALTVNADGGSSVVQLGAMDNSFAPASEIFTGQAGDTFQFMNATAVPSTTALTITTATLDLNGLDPTIDALNGNGVITNNGSANSVLSIGSHGGSGTFSGVLEDGTTNNVGLTELGGTETLSGTNTYSGPTTITAGTLQAGAGDAFSPNSDVADNATLDLAGFSQEIGALSGDGSVTSSAHGTITLQIGGDNASATFSGTIANGSATSLAVTKAGSGTEIFNSDASTYTGGTTINAGTLQIGDGTNFGGVGTAGVSIAGGTLQFDSPADSTASAATFANNISGAGTISVLSGAVLITGTNTSFTGALDITGGSFVLGAAAALGGATTISVSNGGQLDFGSVTSLTVTAAVTLSTTGYIDDDGTVGPLGAIRFAGAGDVLAGPITVTGTALVTAYNGASGTIQGNITGAGTLDVGSGLSAETIFLTGNDSANTTINSDTTLQVGNGGAGGNLTGAASDTDDGSLIFDTTGTTLAASIAGSGTLTQAGSGTLVLPASNTYSYSGNTLVTAGTLQVDGSIAGSSVIVFSGAELTGTGTTGSVTTNGTAIFAPGDPNAPGTLTTAGLNLATGSAFDVSLAPAVPSGVLFSEVNVTSGSIHIAGAVLNLATIDGYVPQGGDNYTIILNNTGNPINEELAAGAGIDNFAQGAALPEGADFSDNFLNTGRTATLTYLGGGDNSVAIGVSYGQEFRYAGGAGPNKFLLKQNTQNFELYDNNVLVATAPIVSTTAIFINVGQANDSALTIDFGGGAFTNKVTFDGGTGSGSLAKTLTIENSAATSAFTSESFTYSGSQSGSIQLDTQAIGYSDLAALADAGGISVAIVTVTLPASTQATLASGGTGFSKISPSTTGFAATTFADPSTSLTLDTSGGSTIQLGAMDNAFSPASEFLTGLASDRFQLTSAAAFAAATSLTLTAGTLDLHGFSPVLNALNGTGTITNGAATLATLTIGHAGGSGAFNGIIQNGVGAVALTEFAGTETLNSANTYSGATTIGTLGMLIDGIANAVPAASTLADNGTFDMAGFAQQVAGLSGSGTVTDSGAAAIFTVNNAAASSFTGTLTGNLALVKSGAGTLTLGHADTYAGSTTVSAGTLKQTASGAVPDNPLIVNGTLDLGGFSLEVPSVAGTGTITNSSATAAVFTLNETGTDSFGGAFTGNLALTVIGAGALSLSKASSYTGATTIGAGTIVDAIGNALPNATALSDNGALDLAGFSQQVGSVTGSGAVTDSGLGGSFTINDALADSFAGALAGSLSLVKSGAGTLTLESADSYTGTTTISAGTLVLAGANAIPATDVTDNAVLDLHGYSVTIGALIGSSAAGSVTTSVAGPVTLTLGATSDNGTFAGKINNGSGTMSLTKEGTGDETLSAAQSFAGPTTITGGTLTISAGLYTAAAPGTVYLASAGVTLNGAGAIHGGAIIQASSFAQKTHIDNVTITLPSVPSSVGITVAPAALSAQIGVTKGVIVNGGSSTSTGVLVEGSAMIFNSNISGHLVDVNVNGGSAVLQKDTLNAGSGSGIGWTGLEAESGAIVDAGQTATDAAPLPAPYPAGNVGLYGDITGLFSGTQLGSTGHSTGGNVFDGYTASTAATNPTTVGQAIRDLNYSSTIPSFSTLPNGVETSFIYGGGYQLGRMDLTAQNNTFNSLAKPTNAQIKALVFDGNRNSGYGFVVYGEPTMSISQSGAPKYAAPGSSYAITINVANTGAMPAIGYVYEYVPANETADLAADPGWTKVGANVYAFNVGLLTAKGSPGSSGSISFSVTVITKPTTVTLTNEALIEPDLTSGIVLGVSYISTTTTVNPNNIRWPG